MSFVSTILESRGINCELWHNLTKLGESNKTLRATVVLRSYRERISIALASTSKVYYKICGHSAYITLRQTNQKQLEKNQKLGVA